MRYFVCVNLFMSWHGNAFYITGLSIRPIAPIPQCTSPISHNALFCNRNVHLCAHFCYKFLHCGMFRLLHYGICEMGPIETETEMSSFWWNFHHWLHWKLSKWQLSVQPVMKISSKWRHFRFSEVTLEVVNRCNLPSEINMGLQASNTGLDPDFDWFPVQNTFGGSSTIWMWIKWWLYGISNSSPRIPILVSCQSHRTYTFDTSKTVHKETAPWKYSHGGHRFTPGGGGVGWGPKWLMLHSCEWRPRQQRLMSIRYISNTKVKSTSIWESLLSEELPGVIWITKTHF